MGTNPSTAASIINTLEGTCFATPVIGAWLADAYVGRFNAIWSFSLLYLGVSALAGTCAARRVRLASLRGFRCGQGAVQECVLLLQAVDASCKMRTVGEPGGVRQGAYRTLPRSAPPYPLARLDVCGSCKGWP